MEMLDTDQTAYLFQCDSPSIPDAISLATVVRSMATKRFYIWRAG